MAVPRSPTQKDQSARVYPLGWIETVFHSKEKTEGLLRPELENGNVTYHDMELAQSFFPNKKRHLPLIYSSLAFLGTVAYSQAFARPKWRLVKLMTISTFLGFGSHTLGFSQNLSAHVKFARSLENPAGFNKALRNINARLGGPEHFPYGVPERREELMGIAVGPGVVALPRDSQVSGSAHDNAEPGEGWTTSPSLEQLDQSQTRQTGQPNVQSPLSKWDQIRAANNKGGTPSSWDLIRQRYERNKIASPSSSHSSTHSPNPAGGTARGDGTYGSYDSSDETGSPVAINENEKKWDKRAFDEAQFEAVLEAERRRASQA